jgi:hypothetical protein
MNQWQQLTLVHCHLGYVELNTSRLSSTEADGTDRINVFQQRDLCAANGKFETVHPVGFDNGAM